MSSNVTLGFNCGYRVEDAAHHVAAVYDLFEHYRRELDLGDYVLQYEALIADQAGETRKLLDYLGLPVEPTYVRATLNDGSLNRHRHYAQQLKPYVSRVRAMMAAYRYE
jgi:hypothetical protein